MSKPHSLGFARTVKVAVVKNSIQNVFAKRLHRSAKSARKIVIASPWISGDGDKANALISIIRAVNRHRIPTYVFTRSPSTKAHNNAIQKLAECPTVELVFNESLHAKVYACIAPYPDGFALLGSANLTSHSEELYEIGLMVLSGGGGEQIVKELAGFGLDYLRTRPDSVVIKPLSSRR